MDCPPESVEAIGLITEERARQQIASPHGEGYTAEHDDNHTEGQLALLAAVYALSSLSELEWLHALYRNLKLTGRLDDWLFKPKDPIRDLVRAGALILAELERRLRREEKDGISNLP